MWEHFKLEKKLKFSRIQNYKEFVVLFCPHILPNWVGIGNSKYWKSGKYSGYEFYNSLLDASMRAVFEATRSNRANLVVVFYPMRKGMKPIHET